MEWDRYVAAEDREILDLAGFGGALGLGDRAAVLVVDMTYSFCGREPMPLRESVRRWPNSCGEAAWTAAAEIATLTAAAREAGAPVIYTKGRSGWTPGAHLGLWADKNRRYGNLAEDLQEIVEPIAPRPGDIVVEKGKPSAFHGTQTLELLIHLGVDSLLVTGATTSGCVRASVVDAFSYNFRVGVVADATVDRSRTSHWVSLFDMHMKYATVLDATAAVAYLAK
jgi:maleamate amidohydrolase